MTERLRALEDELTEEPQNSEAFAELMQRLWDDGDWHSVVTWHERLGAEASELVDYRQLVDDLQEFAEHRESAVEEGRVWTAIGDLCHDELDAFEEGMEAYKTAFRANPEDVTPLEKARNIYRGRQKWDVIVEIYRIELEVTDDSVRRVQLLLKIAQIQADRLDDFEGACQSLDRVENEDADEPFAGQLREFYERGSTVRDAIDEALELAEMGLNDDDASMASAAFIEAAQLEYDSWAGSIEEALRLARRARDIDPESEDARLVVDALESEFDADDSSAPEPVDGGEEPAVSAGPEPGDDAPAGDSQGDPVSEEEEDQERTVQALYAGVDDFDGTVEEARAALKSDRTDLSALKKVRASLRDAGDMAGLAEVLEDSVRYFRKEAGEWEVMTELANLYWLELGDDDQAEYYFRKLRNLFDDEFNEDVFKFYEAYYEDEGDWRRLFRLLGEWTDHIEDRDEYRMMVERQCDIAEFELGNPEKAISAWDGFLDEYPADEEAQRRLRELYESNEKWNALVTLLKEQVRSLADEGEETVDRRIGLLEDMADIYRTHMGLEPMVMKIMSQILELDPDHPDAFRQLRELYEANRRYKDLAELLAHTAERIADRGSVGTAIDRLREAADIWEERLNNQTEAIPHLETIVDIDPRDDQVRQRLRKIYEKRRDFESLFDLRLQEAELLSAAERLEELHELRELARDELGDARREADVLERIVDEEPGELNLLEALESVHRDLENMERVASLLEKRAQLLDGDESIDVLAQAARLQRDELDDDDEALRLWRAVLERELEHEEGFGCLVEICAERRQYDELRELYEQVGKTEELVDFFGDLAADRPEDAAGLHRRRAALCESELGDATGVVEALESLVPIADEPDAVRRELLDWYRELGDIEREIEVRQTLIDGGLDDDEARRQMLTIADLEEERQRPEDALAWALQAFELLPDKTDAFERCEELGRQTGMLDLVVGQTEELVAELNDEGLREWLWAGIARIEWRDLEAHESAVERYEELLERHPEEFEFLEALDELYEITELPEERIAVLEVQIELLRERGAADVDVVDQLAKIADVQRRHLGETEAARQTYSEILDLQSDHLGAIRGLKELHRDDEQWVEVVEYLLREIPLAGYDSPEAQWEAKCELADVYLHRLDDQYEALQQFGEVLGENPEYAPALEAVRDLLAEDGLARDAAMLLEPIFRDLQRYGPLAEALEARLRVCDDRFEEQEILDELIPLYDDELEEAEAAFEYARRQFEIDPERDDIWLQFEQIGAKLDRWELVEEMFSAESPLEGHESPTRYDLLRHLAAIREHRLQQPEAALTAWEKLHDYDPFDEAALEALERLYRKFDDTEKLVDVLRKRADLIDDDEERVELWLEAGALLADELDEPVEAIDVCRQILGIEPEQADAVDRLRDLYRERREWHDLDDLLSTQADQTLEPDLRREYRASLARLRYRRLDDRPGAIAIICQLLDDDPGDDEMLDFARDVDAELADDDAAIDLRLDLARTLEPLYRMRGEYERLDETLQVRLEAADAFEKIELLDELAELRQQRLSDPEAALEAIQRAVMLQPEDEERRSKLLEMSIGLDVLPSAVDTLEAAARDADPFVALPIWKRLGRIVGEQLGDVERAIDCFDEARSIDDTDQELLEELEELFEATNQTERLCDNLTEQARFADREERLELLRRVATLQEHVLDEPTDAADTHRQILEIEPGDLNSIEALEALYEQRDQYFDLVELLRRKLDLVEDEDARIEVLEKWASIADEELRDVDQAIDVYRQILADRPEHRRALAELGRLLRQEMQWAQWADIARRRIDGPERGRPEIRRELELKLAEVHVEELFEIEEAIEIYRGLLERDRDQAEAIEALEELAQRESWLEEVADDLVGIYRRQERHEDLADLYRRRSRHAMDPQEEARLEFQRGTVLRDRLEQLDEAMKSFANAWRGQRDNQQYKRALLEAGTSSESWNLLVDLLDDVLEAAVEPQRVRELQLMIAGLYTDVLDDPMRAEDYLRELLSSQPGHREAFESLFEILESQERWHDLIDLLEQRHDAIIADNQREAIELLSTVAAIEEGQLDDDFSAAETHRQILSVDAQHRPSLDDLERLLRSAERWEELARFYEERVDEAPVPSEQLDAQLALAELCRGPLEQLRRAIELYGDVLDIDADHEEAVQALEALFEEEPGVRAETARLLEPVHRLQQHDESLVEVLQAQVDATDDVNERVELLSELSVLLSERVDDPAHGWAVAAELFSLRPTNADIGHRLWELTARASGWNQLCEVYETTLEENFDIDDETRADLHLDVAEIYADRLREPIAAQQAAQEAMRIRPDDRDAIELLERLLQQREAWHELADFYRDRGDFAADEQRERRWYEKLAVLYEDVLEDADAVVDVYARLLELAPGNEDYRKAMERILAAKERWYELADIYRQRIAGAVDPQVVIDNRLALAEMLERELGKVEEAVDQYRKILEDDADNSDAARALEGLRRDLARGDEQWRPLRERIIELLLDVYDRRTQWRRIDDLFKQQSELVEEPGRRVEILVEKAELLLTSTDDDIERIQALTDLARAFCLDPENQDLDEMIEVLSEDLNAWQRLIPIYLGALGETDDVDRQGLILAAVADIYEQRLDDTESAIAAYQQSVEISAKSERALEKLEELYGEMAKWEPLVEILERRLDEIHDAGRQQSLRKRIARICDERLDDPRRAIELYEEIRREEPTELSHLVVLERLYESVEDFQALEELLEDKLQLVDADRLRAQVFLRLGSIRRDHLGDVERALASFRDALAVKPADREAEDALIGLYADEQRWGEMLDVMGQRRDRADSTEEANEVELEMADVLLDEAGDAERAFEHYRAVLERDPDAYAARGALFRLLADDQVRRRAADVLIGLHRRDQEWDELEALYQRLIEQSDDPEYAGEQYLALAQLQSEAFELPIKAFATLSEAISDVPGVEDVRREFERLAEELDSTDDLVPIYEEVLDEGIDDPEVRLQLHLQVGLGYAERMGDAEAATPHLEAVLDIDEYHQEALTWLDRIYQSTKDWGNLARILEREIDVVDGEQQLQAIYQLGYLREVAYEEYEEALELYRRVISRAPDHQGAIQGLERLAEEPALRDEILELLEPTYRDTEDWAKLARLFELKLDVIDNPVDRAELLDELATVEFEELGRVAVAFEHWGQSLALQPENRAIEDRLEQLAERLSMSEELVDVYQDVIEVCDDPVRGLEIAERGGELAVETLEDRSRAAVFYRRVLEFDPEHEEALEILEDVARSQGDDESLAAVLAARVESAPDDAQRVELYDELASVRLGIENYEGALEAFEALLDLEGEELERLETMARLYELTEQWEGRVDMLQRLMGYRDDDMARRDAYVEMGTICLEHLEDARRARAHLDEALAIESTDDVIEVLEDVYEELEDWSALRDLLDRQLESVDGEDDGERLRLLIRRADVRYEADGDVEGAIEDYRRALAIRDDHPDVFEALDTLYRQEKRWDELLELLNARVNQADDEERIADYYREMTQLADDRLDKPDSAIEFGESVLAVHPGDEAMLDRLEEIHRRRGDYGGVVDIIDRRLKFADGDRRTELLRQRARTLYDDAQAPSRAAEAYEMLLEEFPGDDEIMDTLEEIYGDIGDGERLFALLDRRATHCEDDDRRVELYVQMGDVAGKYLDGTEKRIEALEAARQIAGDDLDVVEPLLDGYIEAGHYDRARPLLTSVIETLSDARRMKEVVRFHHLRGKLARRQGDVEAARKAFEEAHRIDSTYIPNLLSLGELLFDEKLWEEAKKIYQILLLHQMNIDDDADKLEVYFHLGAIREAIGEERGARDMYKRALRVDPDHEDANAALAALDG